MPAAEREWAREPLPAERIEPQNPEKSDEAFQDWELIETGDGYRAQPVGRLNFGCGAILLWFVILVVTRCAAG